MPTALQWQLKLHGKDEQVPYCTSLPAMQFIWLVVTAGSLAKKRTTYMHCNFESVCEFQTFQVGAIHLTLHYRKATCYDFAFLICTRRDQGWMFHKKRNSVQLCSRTEKQYGVRVWAKGYVCLLEQMAGVGGGEPFWGFFLGGGQQENYRVSLLHTCEQLPLSECRGKRVKFLHVGGRKALHLPGRKRKQLAKVYEILSCLIVWGI